MDQLEIKNVEDVLTSVKTIINNAVKSDFQTTTSSPYFGVWFRGQINSTWDLQPSIFRKTYDEASMFIHFQAVEPKFHNSHRNSFDWLTLMQHYSLPTRLIDWTENLLTALFFSVWSQNSIEENEDKDGRLFILAARKLNRVVTWHPSIFIPDSFHVVTRATLSRASDINEWKNDMHDSHFSRGSEGAEEFKNSLDTNQKITNDKDLISRLSMPIAVFPNRINRRLVAQSGTFTIHGGKRGTKSVGLPLPTSLKQLNDDTGQNDKFLWDITIPRNKKKKIRNDLQMLGIHEGTMFPDLDYQSRYLSKLWVQESHSI